MKRRRNVPATPTITVPSNTSDDGSGVTLSPPTLPVLPFTPRMSDVSASGINFYGN